MLTSERNPNPVIECSECGTDCTFENEVITDSEGDHSICLDCMEKELDDQQAASEEALYS